MVNLAVVLAVLALLAWAFVALTRRYAQAELSFWQALFILFAARGGSRLSLLIPDTEYSPRFGVTLAIYLIVLTGGLILVAKVRPLVALLISVGVSLAAILVPFALVMAGIL